jgi:hypothetical protein
MHQQPAGRTDRRGQRAGQAAAELLVCHDEIGKGARAAEVLGQPESRQPDGHCVGEVTHCIVRRRVRQRVDELGQPPFTEAAQ